MKYICKLARHHTSYQIVLPKKLVNEKGWAFKDVLVITSDDTDSLKIQTIEKWVEEKKDDNRNNQ